MSVFSPQKTITPWMGEDLGPREMKINLSISQCKVCQPQFAMVRGDVVVRAIPVVDHASAQSWWACIARCGCNADTDSNLAMRTARQTSKTKTLRNKALFLPHFSLLVVRNRSWKCLNEGHCTLRFVWHRNVAIRMSKVHSGKRTVSRRN